ncbi:hypothetical protein [Nocardioides antri]|uniref:Uncharacterized protein n=1 Tax=Nocardioides antri TaxID=2607659 RepID=A0A5B1LVA2_9ACTN|nr:hypothetical protein [Nocardioides antri]KAA1424068.1 hypothetical protein F0U47_19680 [Nocardioides antri]
MSVERDRAVLEEIVRAVVERHEEIRSEWQSPGSAWSAHVRLHSDEGRACDLLTGAEWQEVRFEHRNRSAFILTTTDEDDVRDALCRLAQVAEAYLLGRGRVEHRRGIFGRRSVLVLPTAEGEWRIGKRASNPPPMAGGGST